MKVEITLPPTSSFEENIVELAEFYDKNTEPGRGRFFDFSKTPEYEKPLFEYLTKCCNWKQETAKFLRKPRQ